MSDYHVQNSEFDMNKAFESSSPNGETSYNSDQQNHADNETVSDLIKNKKTEVKKIIIFYLESKKQPTGI